MMNVGMGMCTLFCMWVPSSRYVCWCRREVDDEEEMIRTDGRRVFDIEGKVPWEVVSSPVGQ